MKNRIHILGILILMCCIGCTQDLTEDDPEGSQPTTRTGSLTTTDYYWYQGEKIGLNKDESKKYILFQQSERAALAQTTNVQFVEAPQTVVLSASIRPLTANASQSLSTPAEKELMWAVVSAATVQGTLSNTLYEAPFFTLTTGKEVGLSHLFYVKLKQESDRDQLISLASANRVEVLGRNEFMPLWYTLACSNESAGNALQMANQFYETGKFASCQPDLICDDELYAAVNDPLYSSQWHLKNTSTPEADIKFEQARTISRGSQNIIVAVVDEGIQLNHPDLNVHSVSFDSETGRQPSVLYGTHGTNCSGFISAKTNNGIGVASIAPDCKLMSVSNSLRGAPDSRQKRADAINFARNNNASVITNSWGSSVRYQIIDDAIADAIRYGRSGKGCVVVFASGNDYSSSVAYPANCHPDILAVGAIGSSGSRASFSNYGTVLDLVAPGQSVTTTTTNSDYTSGISGTSFACPIVAGVAALVLSINPDLTQKQVADILESTAAKCGNYSYTTQSGYPNGTWNNQMGYGLVDAHAAALKAQQTLHNQDLYITNRTFSDNQSFISFKRIYMENVAVQQGGSLTLQAGRGFQIDQPFTVHPAARLRMQQTI